MRSAGIWRRAAAAGVLAAAVAVLASAPASAGQSVAVAGPYAAVTGFATPQLVIFEGDTLAFANADISAHLIEAKDFSPAGSPIFASARATIGQSVPVNGVEALSPGAYSFACTIHTTMIGTLTVLAR